VDRILWAMSRWNDRVQAALFDRGKARADIYGAGDNDAFPLQRLLRRGAAPVIDGAGYRLELSG